MKQINSIIVSSCLLGNNCKYNGGNNRSESVIELNKMFNLIPICPEVDGGLSIPRIPCEIYKNKVISKNGDDYTEEYQKGAMIALDMAKKNNAKYAILKKRSPSCGYLEIYDGTFSHKIIEGNGICADLLYKNGIVILNEDNFSKELLN